MKNVKLLAAPLLLGLLLASCLKEVEPGSKPNDVSSAAPQANPIAEETSNKHVPNEVLVKFKKGISEAGKEKAFEKISGRVKEKIMSASISGFPDEDVYVLNTPLQALEAVSKMKGSMEIEIVEPNYIYKKIEPLVETNDPYYTNPNENIWGMMGDLTNPLKAPMGCQAGEAWSGINLSGIAGALPVHTGSKDVYVAVIDEGIQYTHPDLKANIFINPKEGTKANKKDDDGNGYVDDFYGWDFAGRNNSTYDGTYDDHGTHVAGTIGAKGNNGIGVAGVCWDVKIITAKFLGINGGTTSNAIAAINYIIDLKNRHGLNIVACNNSWGGGSYSEALKQAIGKASLANILFIVAAGNDGSNNDVTPSYPSSYTFSGYSINGVPVADNIISVGALWLDGTKSGFSNYGATSVDIFAPGQRIWSTTPTNSGYSNYSGTSMACPHVTGAAALYASANPGKTAVDIKKAILQSAIPTPAFEGKCVSGSRLDAHSAWQNLQNNTIVY